MKLQTMLLPTGEFIVVASEVPRSAVGDPALFSENFKTFRERAGAVAGWVTDQPVEVDDALYDENARRADDDEEEPGEWKNLGYTTDESHLFIAPLDQKFGADDFVRARLDQSAKWGRTFFPRAKVEPDGPVVSLTLDRREGDDNLIEALLADRHFTPAGLVHGGKTTVSEADLIGVPFTHTERHFRRFVVDGIGVANLVEPVDVDEIGTESGRPVATSRDHPGVPGRSPYFGPETHDLFLDDVVVDAPDIKEPELSPEDIIALVTFDESHLVRSDG